MRDIDVRRALRDRLDREHGLDPETRIVEELGLCSGDARVDVAVVNGTLHGYEIKSERDTLERLPGQVLAYGAVLERVTLVCGSSHVDAAIAIIPKWWGIITATASDGSSVSLKVARRGRRNPALDLVAVAALLWKDEALALLETKGLARGLRGKRRELLYEKLATSIPAADLLDSVRCQLRRRAGWRSAAPCRSGGDSSRPGPTS